LKGRLPPFELIMVIDCVATKNRFNNKGIIQYPPSLEKRKCIIIKSEIKKESNINVCSRKLLI
jgi:hypothetical protein